MDTITLDFDESISDKDLPKIQIYFTSEENTYGVITSQWLNGDVTSVNIDPNEKLFYLIGLRPVEHRKHEEISGCSYESHIRCSSLR